MQDPVELRAAASRYRRLVAGICDRQAIQALNELADEYDTLAAALEKEDFVRRRAYEIWEEQGVPTAYAPSIGQWQSRSWSTGANGTGNRLGSEPAAVPGGSNLSCGATCADNPEQHPAARRVLRLIWEARSWTWGRPAGVRCKPPSGALS
jgi:hypothetical protein